MLSVESHRIVDMCIKNNTNGKLDLCEIIIFFQRILIWIYFDSCFLNVFQKKHTFFCYGIWPKKYYFRISEIFNISLISVINMCSICIVVFYVIFVFNKILANICFKRCINYPTPTVRIWHALLLYRLKILRVQEACHENKNNFFLLFTNYSDCYYLLLT